jgi:hypothetical protein
MSPERLERLLTGRTAQVRGGHGIGFRVVRELVAASNGDLSAMSAPGTGTRVQIEWPMAAPLAGEMERSGCGLAEDAAAAAASFAGPQRAKGGAACSARAAGARQALYWPPGEVRSTPGLGRAIPGIVVRDLAGVPSRAGDPVRTDPQQPNPYVERVAAR